MGAARNKNRNGSAPKKASINGASRHLSSKALNYKFPSSDRQELHRAEDEILAQVHRCGYDEPSTFAIKLAMDEALVNAVKHGNKLDPHKNVLVKATITPKRATIEIEDEGPGFKRSSVPDPTEDENLCKCSGRGILLMESYMNSVTWTKQGRRVKMVRINQRHLKA